MSEVKLVWITPDAEDLIAYMARVSNPQNQDNPDIQGLIAYMLRMKHVSPFEMVTAVFEITTTRDISRQILRHRSFSFQEFSQRYQSVTELPECELKECRMQDNKNRQSSYPSHDVVLNNTWENIQKAVQDLAIAGYKEALAMGIAKEQARALLPEGLTTTRLYMSGTLRSWIHYVLTRSDPSTQKEHREIANKIGEIMIEHIPTVWEAVRS
jgi:thymidylate synthase (FAD)